MDAVHRRLISMTEDQLQQQALGWLASFGHTPLRKGVELELAWLNLKIQGTRFVRAKHVERRIQGLSLKGKQANFAGLELADLVVTPIGRHVLGKPDREDYAIVESKFRRAPSGRIDGYGLIVLPKEKGPNPATQ